MWLSVTLALAHQGQRRGGACIRPDFIWLLCQPNTPGWFHVRPHSCIYRSATHPPGHSPCPSASLLPFLSSPPPSSSTPLLRFSSPSPVVESIPTQRATTAITRLEPPEQTTAVKQILARAATLVRQLLVAADDGVADGALRLALHRALDVAAPGGEAVDDRAILMSPSVSRPCRQV